MAYEYYTKVPFGLKISQLSANAGSGGRFVQKSAGNVRNDLSGPISESPDPVFALNCKILRPNGPLIYVQCDPKLWGSQVPVCENAMRAENVIHF